MVDGCAIPKLTVRQGGWIRRSMRPGVVDLLRSGRDADRRSREAVAEDERHLRLFRRVVESSAIPMAIIEETLTGHRIAYANPAFERLSGYNDGELPGRDWWNLFPGHPDSAELKRLQLAVRNGKPAQERVSARGKNGTALWVEVSLSPLSEDDDQEGSPHWVAVFHDITRERRTREELERRACYDELTGLANRYLLNDRFAQATAYAQRHGSSFAVVLIDMSGFKLVNDHWGHDVGDEFLKCVGARLSAAVRAEDTVARLGGDEFVLLLLDADRRESVLDAVQRIRQALERPLPLASCELTPSCCLGLSRYPADGEDLGTLLKKADVALYRAKAEVPAAMGPLSNALAATAGARGR